MTDKITKRPERSPVSFDKLRESQPTKPTNGHLTAKDGKRVIIFTWGRYSITVICLTAIAITFIQKIRF